MTGPRALERRVEPGADDGREGVILALQMVGLLAPLAQRFIGGKAGRLAERLVNGGQHVWGQRKGLASRDLQGPQGLQAARFIAGEPVAAGVAMDAQPLGHLLAGLGWPAGEPIEHLEAWLLATILCTL